MQSKTRASNAGYNVTVKEAAMLFYVHPRTIRNWIDAGKLSTIQIGLRLDHRIKEDDLKALYGDDEEYELEMKKVRAELERRTGLKSKRAQERWKASLDEKLMRKE